MLARLEQDYTRPTVEAVCAWLAVARAGLLEAEVLDVLTLDEQEGKTGSWKTS